MGSSIAQSHLALGGFERSKSGSLAQGVIGDLYVTHIFYW